MPTLLADFRYAVRGLWRSPSFTIAAVLTLALGIGANTAIFSLVNRVFLRPLPFDRADRLVLLWGDNPHSGWDRLPLSFPNYSDVRAQATAFEEMGAWASSRDRRLNLSGGSEPEEIQYAAGSASLFRALHVRPELGRTFSDEEDQPGVEHVALISHGLWQRRFGDDQALGGQDLILDGEPYRIVGVLPADFSFVSFPRSPDVWLPLQADPGTGQGNRSVRYARGANYLGAIARLKDGVSEDQGRTEVASIARGLVERYPGFNTGWNLRLIPLREYLVGPLQPAILVLMSAVALVLLIACANVAGLSLARGAGRERELSIRAALGATRSRIVVQLLAESVVVAVLGGAVGLLLAFWIIALPTFSLFSHPDLFLPYSFAAEPLTLDLWVMGFTFGLSLLTGVLFGLAPALRASRLNLSASLKSGSAQTGSSRQRGRALLVMSEVTISMVLLTGAGLLIRSLILLERVDPGLRPDRVLAVDLNLNRSRYGDPRRAATFYQTLLERLGAIPGVRSVSAVEQMPFSGELASTDFRIEGKPEPASNAEPEARYGTITPGYLHTLGIRLIAGRAFEPQDRAGSLPVAVINEAMARRYWPGENPLGKRFALSVEALVFAADGPPHLDFPGAMREVVGVVADVRNSGLTAAAAPEAYLPFAQRPARNMTIVASTTDDPLSLAEAVRRSVLELDKDQSVSSVRSLDAMVAGSLGEPRFRTYLLAGFSAVALLLAAVGLAGLVAYTVAQRRREIGVRMAFGAGRGDVLRLILSEGLRPVVAGIVIGTIIAWAASRVLAGLLFAVTPTDPLTFVVIPLLLGLGAMLACYLPARRVLRIDPAEAMRVE